MPAPLPLSVLIFAHNSHPGRLARTLAALQAQTLPAEQWEALLVDNASTLPLDVSAFPHRPTQLRVVRESRLGLSFARQRGLQESQGAFVVFVDDDNVLGPDYLTRVLQHFAAHPGVGALGGRSLPEFSAKPEKWTHEFHGLLALRDLGEETILATTLRPAGARQNHYPACAPIGAGLALRRDAAQRWLDAAAATAALLPDRRGRDLSSGGDNDLVFHVMHAGWAVGYFPDLVLTHLIPSERLQPDYLARLNRGIQRSWMEVLTLHAANSWPPLTPTAALARKFKGWWVHQPWLSAARRVRYAGACGHFDGRTTAFVLSQAQRAAAAPSR